MAETLRPPRLQPGDRVRLVSPASTPDVAGVEEARSVLEGWGLVVEVGAHALDRWGIYAGRVEDRLADLDDAFRDPGVRAVITTRGGAGAYLVADGIDVDAVRADPKPVVGFSDVTYLHLALWASCRLGSVSGCVPGAVAGVSTRQLLMTTDPITLRSDEDRFSAAVRFPGRATGPLVGGNLTAVAASVGVRLAGLEGAVLLLEDQRVKGFGLVDRQLAQLVQSGALDRVAGIALGSFDGFRDLEDRGWTVLDVLRERLGRFGVPVLGGLFVGHDMVGPDGRPDLCSVPLGGEAVLDADAGTLTVGPCVR